MTQMHDINFFWGIVRIGKPNRKLTNTKKTKITKFYARDSVNEIEHPYRTCKDAFFIRISLRRFLTIGQWDQYKIIDDDEINEDKLTKAVNGS